MCWRFSPTKTVRVYLYNLLEIDKATVNKLLKIVEECKTGRDSVEL